MKNLITNEIRTVHFTSGGKNLKVHAVQTGSISVKKNFLDQKGKGFLSKLNIVMSNAYAEFIPIWVWIIEHPEGIIVIDTGEIEAADHQEFYKEEPFFNKLTLKAMSNVLKVGKEDELDSQLLKLGIKPERVSKVVLTHLHGDHTDGLKFFGSNEIIVNEAEHKKPYGNLPSTYPKWFRPTLVNFSKNKSDVFDSAFPLTKSEDILLVPTPGHTYHHSSVLLRTDKEHILFAGDISYTDQQLMSNRFSGSNVDYTQTQTSYSKVKLYAERYPLIYLPSHDENSGKRLAEKLVLV